MLDKHKSGIAGEDLAVEFLQKKGYRILERNYRYEHGEIDIIAADGDTLVFVEVKARHSQEFVEPEDAVTERKCEVIHRTADGYLLQQNLEEKDYRFDIVAIDYVGGRPSICHIEDAF